jgi:outer membrane protein TolC
MTFAFRAPRALSLLRLSAGCLLAGSVFAAPQMQEMTPVAPARTAPPPATVQPTAPQSANNAATPAPPPPRGTPTQAAEPPEPPQAARAEEQVLPPPTASPQARRPEPRAQSALLAMPATPKVAPQDILEQIPDPTTAPDVFARRLQALKSVPKQEPRVLQTYENVVRYALEYLDQLKRPQQVKLSLSECIRRALANSYRVRIESYTPAIAQAQLVQAEARFDAEVFLDYSFDNIDRAVASDIAVGTSDTRTIQGGVRQLLPTGAQVSLTARHVRQETDFQFQTINPSYQTTMVAEIRQPLLRGFGLDVNRAQINIANVQRSISMEQFAQNVRDTLLEVEVAYWDLVRARRNAAILAETVAQNRATYESVYNRRDHDATEVEIQNSKSRWDQRVVEYTETIRLVRDAEDRLKNLINDPELLLSSTMEIIPDDTPLVAPLQVDLFADVRTAIEKRHEILQSRGAIEIARINTNVAKNNELPQFDFTFAYTIDGVEGSADNSFDRLGSGRFMSYNFGVNIVWPVGNRLAKAATRQRRLEESQSVVRLQQVIDSVVEEVNRAVRLLVVRWVQVPTQVDAVRAAERNLRALQARTQRIDPPYLETELGAVEQLANTRTRLLQIVIEYTSAVAQLEKAKGTLLEYNKVSIAERKGS